ncbi:IS66 family insertion sequence transposase domain-containing protein (plasmid) [Rhizobium sp. NXC24]|nr:IS66 family insertion sequence transposase domain-containing protein [Rhizobium sp. NXC24]
MSLPPLSLPDDLASAHTALLAEREARLQAEAEATTKAKAELSSIEALNAHLQLLIAKLERDKHGPSRERTQRLIDQMELQLEELVADSTEDELASEAASAKSQTVRAFTRKRPVRKPWPDNIERERVVIEAPGAYTHCGSERLWKLGEDTTETLEEIPRRFKVVQTVRDKFTCRGCGCISQAGALP